MKRRYLIAGAGLAVAAGLYALLPPGASTLLSRYEVVKQRCLYGQVTMAGPLVETQYCGEYERLGAELRRRGYDPIAY